MSKKEKTRATREKGTKKRKTNKRENRAVKAKRNKTWSDVS
jgi:hypothetical protein